MAISKFITRAEVPNNVPNNVPSNGIYDLISRGIQDAKNYASIPATYAAGLYGNYINKNVGENMARSFRTDEMNERLSQQVGDQLPPGVNSGSLTYKDFGLPAGPSKYLGDGKFEPNRMFTAPTFKETMNVNSADLANAYTLGNLNFNRNPSGDINYTGNTYDFPQPTFMNNNPMDIPLDELNVNAPEFRFTDYLQGNYDINKFDERPSENTLQARQTRQASSARSLGMDKEIQKEKGIFSLGNILADLGRKGVEGFKDVAGRGIASQALSGAGGMVFGLPGALAGLVFGGLKGGDLFKRDPVFSDFSQPGNPTGMRTRRAADRISYMLNRGAAGKNFSQRNLDNMLRGFGMSDVDTQGMMDSIAQSAQTGYGGYGSSDDAAAAAASGGRDYSSSPGAMAGDMEYGEE